MDDLSNVDGWASFFLGLIVSFIGGLSLIFNTKERVKIAERDIKLLKDDHDKRLDSIWHQLALVRQEVRQDIKDVGDRTEKRADTLEEMLRAVLRSVK